MYKKVYSVLTSQDILAQSICKKVANFEGAGKIVYIVTDSIDIPKSKESLDVSSIAISSVRTSASDMSTCDRMCSRNRTSSVNDTQPLLSSSTSEDETSNVVRYVSFRCSPADICIKSKAVFLIFLWSIYFGGAYCGYNLVSLFVSYYNMPLKVNSSLQLLVFYVLQFSLFH